VSGQRLNLAAIPGPPRLRTITVSFVGLALFTLLAITTRWPMGAVGIVLALVGLMYEKRKLRFPAPFWWAVAMVSWACLGAFFALSPAVAWDAVTVRLKIMIAFFVILNVLRSEKQIRLYLLIVVAAFMIYPARGALLNYVHGYRLFGRIIWNNTYANPNDLGAVALLVTGAALSIASVKTEVRAVRWGTAVSVATMIVVMLLTQSRGVFLGLSFGLGVPILQRMLRRPMFAIYVFIAASIGLALLPSSLWVRLSGMTKLTSVATIAQADPEGSAAERWGIQKTAWRIFVDHPIMGVGLGCYERANAQYSPDIGYRDTHDTYLNLAAELGLPGLIMWIGLVMSVLAKCQRGPHREQRPEDASSIQPFWMQRVVLGFLVLAIFGSYSGITTFYMVLGALWCTAVNDRHMGSRSTASTPSRKGRGLTRRLAKFPKTYLRSQYICCFAKEPIPHEEKVSARVLRGEYGSLTNNAGARDRVPIV
jgi:O-antigen ligase